MLADPAIRARSLPGRLGPGERRLGPGERLTTSDKKKDNVSHRVGTRWSRRDG
jgi:hypothetical protein